MSLNRRISEQIDEPGEKRVYVRRLFAGVAHRYDLTNDVMSLGLHRRWKRRLLRLADLTPGLRVLDLAAGTGDLGLGALGMVEADGPGPGEAIGRRLEVVAADLTPEMMRVGMQRDVPAPLGWVAADAARLPFADGSFDRVLIGYGLRNFADLDGGLSEILRCLRPGGRLLSLDFGHPPVPAVRGAYFGYLNASTRVVGWALHRDAESYVYIAESLRRVPTQREMVGRMEAAGYTACGYEDVMIGTMAINWGTRPEE